VSAGVVKSWLLRGGRLIDPAANRDETADVLIEDGRITVVGRDLPHGRATVLDASGLVVAPGLVDIHVHLREPGQTHKEDVVSGTAAAARGGVTAIVCMANTTPPVDHPSIITALLERARSAGSATVYPIASITRGMAGKELSPIASLAAAGAVGISDDGKSVADAALLRRAMIYAKPFGVPILEHCEEPSLADGGAMHEGAFSARLGLRGIPRSAEEVIIARDLILAAETGCRLHVQHVSTAGAVQLIREAKQRGVPVTAEATPHHFTLTDESLERYDTNFKMNPPLRTREDLEAVLHGLADGTIDCIATDHAPHAEQEKLVEFDRAPMGIVGLETLFGLTLTRLHHQLGWTLLRILALLTSQPANVLKLPKGTLRPGEDADVVILDPNLEWRVNPATFASKSRNTPFGGWALRGKVLATFSNGRLVWRDDAMADRMPAAVEAAPGAPALGGGV